MAAARCRRLLGKRKREGGRGYLLFLPYTELYLRPSLKHASVSKFCVSRNLSVSIGCLLKEEECVVRAGSYTSTDQL